MFKEYVRQDEYIITAIIFVRKLLDTNTSLSMKTAKPYTQIALKQKNMPCVFSIHIAKA